MSSSQAHHLSASSSSLSLSLFLQELERQKYIYTKGCVGQFEKWLQDNLIIVAGIFVGIALLQVSQTDSFAAAIAHSDVFSSRHFNDAEALL